ncbi:hypothetical protein EDF46_2256 [Frondihabitans sp. PhB188]|uniref:hypothetical protein n=1 Tax=Frondihabitans sp. PhB188 TaxID=2485200 RepID=UPI000F493DE5|nr:hypothetical protein [Frondihabitans sp. PhB188]ROQ38616.1 hypothetical protein EDF46_2256 [Frondihabitans sp. PhB188]
MALRISVGAAIVLALLMAFFFVRTSDELAPRGTQTVVTVWDKGDGRTRSEARQLMIDEARRQHLTLYKSVTAATDGATSRKLFIINSEPATALATASTDGYPDFSRSQRTVFADGRELPDAELDGMYVTDAGEEGADAYALALNARGMSVSTLPFGVVGIGFWIADEVPIVSVSLAAVLMLALGCIFDAVSSRRRAAIARLAGRSRSVIVIHESLITGLTGAVSAVGACVLGFVAIVAYNGGAQIGRLGVAAGVACGAICIVSMAFTAAAVVTTTGSGLASVLAVRAPSRRIVVGAAGVHASILPLVLTTLSPTVLAAGTVAANTRERQQWDSVSDYFALSFRSQPAEFDESESVVARIIRTELDGGRAMITFTPMDPDDGYSPGRGNSLIVTDRYLDEVRVNRSDGSAVVASDLPDTSLTLLIPETLVEQSAQIVAEYRSWISYQVGSEAGDGREAPAIDVIPIASDQEIFSFQTWVVSRSSLTEPVIAVLPSEASLLSDNWLSSTVTSAEILFDDPASIQAAIDAAGLTDQIGAIESVKDLAAVRLAEQSVTVRASLFIGGVAIVSLVLSALVLATIVAQRSRRAVALRFIHGVTLFRVMTPALVCLAVLSAAILVAAFSRGSSADGVRWAMTLCVVADAAIVALALGAQRRTERNLR